MAKIAFSPKHAFLALIVATVVGWFLHVAATVLNATATRFAISIPIRTGNQKIHATLPYGNYVLIISTNFDNRTFDVIPPERDYKANVTIHISALRGPILQFTNIHYQNFKLGKNDGNEVDIVVDVKAQPEDETLLLNMARGF